MAEIVERLRAWHSPGETITGDIQLYLDAADEIERLREALAFYADDANYRLNGKCDPNSGNFTGPVTAWAALACTSQPDHSAGPRES